MQVLLLNIFFLLKPLLSVNFPGFSGNFDSVAIFLTTLLGLVALYNLISKKMKSLTPVERSIIWFVAWCCAISLVYFSDTDFRILMKWLIPPLTYLIVRRAYTDKFSLWVSWRWILVGFSVPVMYSAYLILTGEGLWNIDYWTGEGRYAGAYTGPHEMSHNLAFFIIFSFSYVFLGKAKRYPKVSQAFRVYLTVMCLLALFCIFKGSVRTVLVGLTVFALLWALQRNKVLFLVLLLVGGGGAIYSGVLSKIFYGVSGAYSGEVEIDAVGSGRPYIWKRNLEVFSFKTVDRWIAGVGVGNFEKHPTWKEDLNIQAKIWNSHNDYLETLLETGLIGFVMIFIIYGKFLLLAKSLSKSEQSIFVSMVIAVIVMNFLSNSYISRFSVAQLFFIFLAYMELPDRKERSAAVVQGESVKIGEAHNVL